MQVSATAKYVKVQPRKVRIVADEVRGKNAVRMAHVLNFHPSKSATALRKVLISAIANASETHGLNSERLTVAAIQVNEGPYQKRIIARAMGRANRIIKKTSHITVVVEEAEAAKTVKPHGTKAKARPSFDKPKGKKPAKETAKAAAEAPAEETAVEETPVAVAEATEEVTAVETEATPEVATEEVVAEETPAEETPAEETEEKN